MTKKITRDFIKDNLIAGVYTNRDTYLKGFTENWEKYYQGLPLIYNVRKGRINENMENLRLDFREKHPDKRYWLFLDDDILFTKNNVIETALEYMIGEDLALCGVYQTHDIILANRLNNTGLKGSSTSEIEGYFMLVDSQKIGLIPFDKNIPTDTGNLADLDYCLNVNRHGHFIGIAPTFVFHKGTSSPKQEKLFELTADNEKKVNKNVKNFLKNLDKKHYYGNKEIEIVFLSNGNIDKNETIGRQYLKQKYKNETIST